MQLMTVMLHRTCIICRNLRRNLSKEKIISAQSGLMKILTNNLFKNSTFNRDIQFYKVWTHNLTWMWNHWVLHMSFTMWVEYKISTNLVIGFRIKKEWICNWFLPNHFVRTTVILFRTRGPYFWANFEYHHRSLNGPYFSFSFL